MTEVSNIDELLTAQNGPRAPEMQDSESSAIEEESSNEDELTNTEYDERNNDRATKEDDGGDDRDREEIAKDTSDLDDYGNTKGKPKVYTEEEVNERINKAIRERLARGNAGQQQAQAQPQQPQQEFAYNPDSAENWEQQLERFVETTVSKMGQKQVQQQHQQREAEAEANFRDNFTNGMARFSDFREVVQQQPITDDMTRALRGIKDPSAFIYAASKRHPQELQRISQLQDPYSQIVEIGKLEERMRKTATLTNAPKPVGRTQDDGITKPIPKKRDDTIEDLIAKSDAKRRAALDARRTGSRR
jgi:hypothetical protein